MKGSLKIVGTILSMLIVFIVFVWVLTIVLGSPKCDELANNTAYNLKIAIDEVSTNKVSFTDFGEEPDPTQYRTAVIRLCQEDYLWSKLTGQSKTENIVDQIYSWILKLSGGEPQYKIYYEIFPEEGAMWKESYPWSGGAASTFAFWAVMRGVNFGIEYLSPAFLSLKGGWKALKWLIGSGKAAEKAVEASTEFSINYGKPFILGNLMLQYGTSFIITSGVNQSISKFNNILFFSGERRNAIYASELLNKEHSKAVIQALADSGYIRKRSGEMIRVGNKIALNNEELPMLFPRKVVKNNKLVVEDEYAVAVYQSGGGELDPEKVDWNNIKEITFSKGETVEDLRDKVKQQYGNDYVLLTFKPNELVRDMYEELSKSSDPYDKQRARELENYWYWEEEDIGTTFTIDEILQTNYGFDIYKKGHEKFKSNIESLSKQGFLTKDTVLHSGDLTKMIEGFREAAFASDLDAQNIQEAFLSILADKSNGVFDKICYIFNRTGTCTVSINDMFNALQSDLSSPIKTGLYHPEVGNGGIFLLWENFSINIDVKIMDIIMTHPGGVTKDYLVNEVKKFNKFGFSDDYIWNIYLEQYNWFIDSNGGNGDIYSVPKAMGKFYLKRWANALKEILTTSNPSQYKWAVDDIGFIIGLYDQKSSTYSVSIPSKYKREVTLSEFNEKDHLSFGTVGTVWEFVKRPLFWNVKQIITPTSGIAKGFILQSVEGCLGNSLCVYSHGALMNPESPMYLNESVKNYFIRLWRPVNPITSVAGIQGILMQVPSHPRFYVVSPCFGLAKVWKTRYQGENTIFIKIDKFDLNDTASNYCYADETLINYYSAIWLISDIAQIIEAVATVGVKRAISKAAQEGIKVSLKTQLAKVFLDFDPVTLAQGFAEAAISWPGWPFKSLTFETMSSTETLIRGGQPFGPPEIK